MRNRTGTFELPGLIRSDVSGCCVGSGPYLETLLESGLCLDEVAVHEVQRGQVVKRLPRLGVLDAQVLATEAKALRHQSSVISHQSSTRESIENVNE